ncbi:selenide, water dikinase SelD [Dokdonella sp.]|uniref:selenide, water dikinase SelD n=1 Tax=Dokdonella sp. TaxID=2291710 RepID=UPI001B0584DA|nr:selenide, water dikinase SelD [Dokdonella sp.]MBO9664575.1 selenide, water dikinase SelD [Dokdonella sp.]
MDTTDTATPRLTSLSHGGGCGCKISPGVLAELLKGVSAPAAFADLLVGRETSDDAAVYRVSDEQAIVATTDFFMPIVDDPFDFGRIAATNAISDVYAMGARPLFALAIVGMPIDRLPRETIRDVLRGGEAICARAGIPIAGGHSIDSVEPIYGLAVVGIAHPQRIRTNASARAGDVLVLGKPVGVGVYSAAYKQGKLDDEAYRALIDTTTRLNDVGVALAALDGVHAMTDVTGFGLLGHLLEVCRASNLGARIQSREIPVLPAAAAFAQAGVATGASARNWRAYGELVELSPPLAPFERTLLTDPQTSGGLLVACAPEAAAEVIDTFRRGGFAQAAAIGTMQAGTARVVVE